MTTAALNRPRGAGEYTAAFSLPSTQGKKVDANDLLGRPLVLFFYLSDAVDGFAEIVTGFRDLYPEFQQLGINVVGVGVQDVETQKKWVQTLGLPYPLASDADAHAAFELGIASPNPESPSALTISQSTFLMNAGLRIVKRYDEIAPKHHAAEVLADARELLFPEPSRLIVEHAPVLLMRNVLSPELCRELVQTWETQGNEDSGFMKQIDGKTVGQYDYNHKIRRDHFLKSGPVLDQVKQQIGIHIVPQIFQAFNYNATRFEDFRVACYDASRGGYFRPHRDNTTEGTAHRRFAMSLLLNDDFEGGHLRFPEHSVHHYRPRAGSAVIFSCSMLHEATDVTAGRRFVLLSFFYGEAEAKKREEYNRRSGGTYRA